jgi:hypothetical protein
MALAITGQLVIGGLSGGYHMVFIVSCTFTPRAHDGCRWMLSRRVQFKIQVHMLERPLNPLGTNRTENHAC